VTSVAATALWLSAVDYMDIWGTEAIATTSGISEPVVVAITQGMESGQLGGRTTDRPRWVGRMLPADVEASMIQKGTEIEADGRVYSVIGVDPADSGFQVLKLAKIGDV